jgi:methionyl-tRNA formyltransferase
VSDERRRGADPRLTLPTAPLGRALRVCIVTQEDPFYIPLFFREFFARPSDEYEVVGVMIQPPLGTRTARALVRRMWSLYGTFGSIRIGVRYVLARIAARTVAWYARRAGVALLECDAEPSIGSRTGRAIPNNANGPSFLSWIKSERIDLIVSVSASQIFRAGVLAAPRFGAINLHNAPLPRYRGMLPNFRQLEAGERESVLTIHEMRVELDRGDVLLQSGTPILSGMSLDRLIRETKTRSARSLHDLLIAISRGEAQLRPLPDDVGSYFGWPTREEARAFRRRGGRLL